MTREPVLPSETALHMEAGATLGFSQLLQIFRVIVFHILCIIFSKAVSLYCTDFKVSNSTNDYES